MRYWKNRNTSDRVGIVITSYLNDDPRRIYALQALYASLAAQTHQGPMHVHLAHDGPIKDLLKTQATALLNSPWDSIAEYERKKQHGHPHRRHAALNAFRPEPEWILLTNDDNYYMPTFLEWLISEGTSKGADAVYCDMIHSHKLWQPMQTSLARGRIDIGCILIRRTLIEKVEWTDFSFAGDWTFIEKLSQVGKVAKVGATLFVHN